MRIVVIGAYGLIGGYVTARLLRDGHTVIGVGRNVAAHQRRFPDVRWVKADLRTTSVAAWETILSGAGAIVNCAGALQDSPRDSLDAAHQDTVSRLIAACNATGVHRFVHISAAGVERGRGRFAATKLAADEALGRSTLEWIVLRPALVLAPGVYGGSALLRGLAGFPGFIPALRPDSVVQIVAVEDIADAVARSVAPGTPARFACDLAADQPTRLRDILTALRGWLGLPPARLVRVPGVIGNLTASVADLLAWLGWRSPMRSAALEQLAAGVQGRSADAPERLGLQPRRLSESLAAWPSGVQDRWHARLYFAKPVALLALALFWIASGVIGFASEAEAMRLLTGAAISQPLAKAFVLGGSAADIALGVLICFRRTATLALKAMLALTAAYLAAATAVSPMLWADPLGPLVKSVPAAILALIVLGMMEER